MPRRPTKNPDPRDVVGLRIIGGHFRGRRLQYSGDLTTRPMKDRVREAIFNLLGPAVHDTWAIDLFAGTGALGLEAISRGATKALFLERHFPTARIIENNADELGVAGLCEIIPTNTFIWIRQSATRERLRSASAQARPWVVFCSPPYELYVSQRDDLLGLLGDLIELAPAGSQFVVESDERFNPADLPRAGAWDTRHYDPAVVSILSC